MTELKCETTVRLRSLRKMVTDGMSPEMGIQWEFSGGYLSGPIEEPYLSLSRLSHFNCSR